MLAMEEILEETKWTVVMDGDTEVFRPSGKGHNKKARKECERFIAAQKFTIQYYRESAAKVDAVQDWIRSVKGSVPKPPTPYGYVSPSRRRY